MAKTGESHAAARAQLLTGKDPVDGDRLAGDDARWRWDEGTESIV